MTGFSVCFNLSVAFHTQKTADRICTVMQLCSCQLCYRFAHSYMRLYTVRRADLLTHVSMQTLSNHEKIRRKIKFPSDNSVIYF